tara:strand:- start:29 stop:295 length:267 start_codon:yes stop_codon:yes gene_type:complete
MVLGSPFTEVEVLKMDIAELTKQNYVSLTRIKELVEKNEKLMIENEKLKKINNELGGQQNDQLDLDLHPLSTTDYKIKESAIWDQQGC